MRTRRPVTADTVPEARLSALFRLAVPRGWADIAASAALAVVYYAAAHLGLGLALIRENVTPLWPPTGIALVAFLVFGRRLWPGVAVAAFFVNEPISTSPAAAAVTAVGNAAAPLIAATLLARLAFRPTLDRLRDAVVLVFVGALSCMTISATIGVAVLLATGSIERADALAAWSVWWAGDAMGVLVFAPFLLTFRPAFRLPALGWRRAAEAVALGVAILVTTFGVVTAPPSMLFLVLPLLGWAAWRFQQHGAAPAALVVSVVATWAAVERLGPFAHGTLLYRMLTLQAFNASVAFTSFLFAALVAERLRDRAALGAWASDLEVRVADRTAELSRANERLRGEIDERTRIEQALRRSEANLEEAQELARLGSWEWDLRSGAVTWSDEMFRLHGYDPNAFAVSFDRAIELVPQADRARIRENVERAIARGDRRVPDIEYPIVLSDGTTRVLSGKGRLDYEGAQPVRMVGTVQDITERREYEREHRIAETLQRALLPKELPRSSAFRLAARYVPAEVGLDCGGDWYDVIELPNGGVALAIGDVSGHGLEAATVMGQLRLALRAYAVEGHPPDIVVGNVDAVLQRIDPDGTATLLYVEMDAETSNATLVSAGHPPPLVVTPEGSVSFLDAPTNRLLGLAASADYVAHVRRIEPGSTLVLYTDGIVDRRDLPVVDGLAGLRAAAEELVLLPVDDLCDRLVDALVPSDVSDDVAILVARTAVAGGPFEMRIHADPAEIRLVRAGLARWLEAANVAAEDRDEVILACSEACANAVEHAYRDGEGDVIVRASVDGGAVEVEVRDRGRWRPPRRDDRGRGLAVMRACMDDVTVEQTGDGTVVRMRHAIAPAAMASVAADG